MYIYSMAFFIAGGVGLFGLVASGCYIGIVHIKNIILKYNRNEITLYNDPYTIIDQVNYGNEYDDIFYLSDVDIKEAVVFYDPIPVGTTVLSYDGPKEISHPHNI